MQLSRGNRRGRNFSVRVSDADMQAFADAGFGSAGPRALGPWLVWRAGQVASKRPGRAMPGPGPGIAAVSAMPGLNDDDSQAVPARTGIAARRGGNAAARRILDLCGGSGAWSSPYALAGYTVEVVDLLGGKNIHEYSPPQKVWGVLAAPPCTEFSIALTSRPRDLEEALRSVTHCLRVIALARPQWWALENPGSGLLRRWLGPPRDVWNPCDFGDAWTKLTAIWGDFVIPQRRHCRPRRGMPGRRAAERAITPPGFAKAFFEANP